MNNNRPGLFQMLKIGESRLNYTSLTYLAFRAAFQDTHEWMVLDRQLKCSRLEGYGYLTEVPFLQGVPPQVQLDLLAETWSRLVAGTPQKCSLIDEAVLYAACETTARLVDEQPNELQRYLDNGPMRFSLKLDQWLVSRVRALHLSLPIEGDFLAISQFEDMPPEEAKQFKSKLGLDQTRLDSLFDLLGRWQVSNRFEHNLKHLLTDREIEVVKRTIEHRPEVDVSGEE
ncbi:hypothetical protein OAH18_00185 [bacterium]|nr:hypothetical protein [bacterium]